MNEHSAETRSADARRSQLIELLERRGEQGVESLASHFGVSGMTIRRDLQDLADEGKVLRTHGGAAPAARITFEFRFLDKLQHRAAQKEAIAELAASLVKPGQSVMLDSGTTTLAVARKLKAISRLTVITTSLPIASELFGIEGIDLILLGGRLRKDAPDLIGAITDQNLDVLRTDFAFIGADAISEDGGLYNGVPDLARMLTRMASCASSIYAVADSSKVGKHELMQFANVRDWKGLITDSELDASHKRLLQKAGVNILQPIGRQQGNQ